MEETDGVAVDQFEPHEIAEEGDNDTLVKDREARSQGKAGYNGIFQHDTHKEQQRRRKQDLVEKRLQGHGPVGQVFLYVHGRRPPQRAAGQSHQITGQSAERKRAQVLHEQGHHTGKRQDETPGLPRVEPVAFKEKMGPQGNEEGGGIHQDIGSGGQSVSEPYIDEAELGTKKQSNYDSVNKDPLGGKKSNPFGLHPDVKARTGHQGAQAGHEQGSQLAGPDLDDGHVGPPDQGEDQEGNYRLPAELGLVHAGYPVLDDKKVFFDWRRIRGIWLGVNRVVDALYSIFNLVRFAHNWNVGILERWNIGFWEIGILVYCKNSS